MSSRGAGPSGVGRSGAGNGGGKPPPQNRKKCDYRKGVKKRQYTYEVRKKIMDMICKGAKTCEIVRACNVPESTVRSMRKQKDTLPATLDVFCRYAPDRRLILNTERNRLLAVTEFYLQKWVSRRDKEGGSICGPNIRETAKMFYAAVAKKKGVSNPPKFNASVGWLSAFKKRCEIKFAAYTGERGSADIQAGKDYPAVFRRIVDEGGYSRHQIFNCDETCHYWKKAPKTTFISKHEKQARGAKPSRERLTVMFTCNATGDCKMKPLVVGTAARPRAYKHADMSRLNVYWYSNKKGWVTSALSSDWFDNHFVPDARRYCQRMNLDFKVLLTMDNAPGHSKFLDGRHPGVQVVFLPPNTTSLLQPLDQEIISTVKLLYYKSLYEDIRLKTDSLCELQEMVVDISDGEEVPPLSPTAPSTTTATTTNSASSATSTSTQPQPLDHRDHSDNEEDVDNPPAPTSIHENSDEDVNDPPPTTSHSTATPDREAIMKVKEFWRAYNIKNAVDRFVDAWNKINTATVLHGWKQLFAVDKNADDVSRQTADSTLQDTLQAARGIRAPGFQDIQAEDITDMISNKQPEATVDDIIEQDDAGEHQEEAEAQQVVSTPTTSNQWISHILTEVSRLVESVSDNDLSPEAVNVVLPGLNQALDHYKAIYNQRIYNRHQAVITRYFLQPPAAVLSDIDVREADDGTIDENVDDVVVPDVIDDDPDFLGFEARVAVSVNDHGVPSDTAATASDDVHSDKGGMEGSVGGAGDQ